MKDPRVEKIAKKLGPDYIGWNDVWLDVYRKQAKDKIQELEDLGLVVVDRAAIKKLFEDKNEEEQTIRDKDHNGSINSTKNSAHHDGFAYGVRWALEQILGEGR